MTVLLRYFSVYDLLNFLVPVRLNGLQLIFMHLIPGPIFLVSHLIRWFLMLKLLYIENYVPNWEETGLVI